MTELVPPLTDSALALSLVETGSDGFEVAEEERDSLLYAASGSGTLTLGRQTFHLQTGSAALVLAGEHASVSGELRLVHATVAEVPDRHAALGEREVVVVLDPDRSEDALGTRSFQLLFGAHNGSTRATLFAGFLPPGRAPWHYHLYDEIVWIPEGPGRLHKRELEEPLGAGSAFRLRPREVHIVENARADAEMTLLGIFTPAGSPAAAYLAD